MSLQDISLPIDIPWKLIATSDDMIANHQKRFPHAMWKSSMAVFSYDPDPANDIPDELLKQNREITYLKVVCSITSYVPPCEECPDPPSPPKEDYGTMQAALKDWRNKCKIINDAEHKAYACSGALVQIAIYPDDVNKETYDPGKLAYFAAFEPKKRELIEVGTESGEAITQSKSAANVRKGTTSTNTTENYDVLTGVNMGGGFAGASANIGVTGNWGTVKKSGSESVNVINSDSSRELREGSSHSSNISHLYHLLNSYHLGTNRAIFFLQPRPHTLQQKDQFTFIDGPQQIEGIQEFFLIVSRPNTMKITDYCLDALLYTAHLDDEASAKAINDPKTAETPWIEFSAIAAKIDDGGHSIWNIAADAQDAYNYLINQAKNAVNIWSGTPDPAATPPKVHPPSTFDGYVTPSFITEPNNTKYNNLLSSFDFITEQLTEYTQATSNSSWKIDRSRGLGGYDLWEDPNNKSGIPTKDELSKVPPEAFVDIVSLNRPDDLEHYLPDYGLRVRAQAWPSTEETTMYHGRIKAYFIRNDVATDQRAINMFVTVRGVSTCTNSPFFNNAPDKAVLIVPDIATENHIYPRNVSPWKTNIQEENKPGFTSIPNPDEDHKQILLSTPKGNSSPSGYDHPTLGAARAKMANMMGKQVLHTLNSSLSCLADRTDGTLMERYSFRESDFFFNNVARKFLDFELNKLSLQVHKEPELSKLLLNHSRISMIQDEIPSFSILKMKYNNYRLEKKEQEKKAMAESKEGPEAKRTMKDKKNNASTGKDKLPTEVKVNRTYPVLTLASTKLKGPEKQILKDAGFRTAFDLLGIPAEDLSQTLGTDLATVRKLRLKMLDIKPPKRRTKPKAAKPTVKAITKPVVKPAAKKTTKSNVK